MEADFSGYATKAGLKCSDGRTIMPDAFKHQDKTTVPLVWQHGHSAPNNILGHAVLEARTDGIYAYGFFNSTEQGQSAKVLVQHGDIKHLSIYANQLVERAKQVFHGAIREVSLVLAGANPGAKIDHVAIQHSDGEIEDLDDEAVIYTGLTLQHAEKSSSSDDSDDDEETIQDVYDSLSDKQKDVVHFIVGAALEAASAEHSDIDEDSEEDSLNHLEGNEMTRNVFEQNNSTSNEPQHTLSHDDMKAIFADAVKSGSLKTAVEGYAVQHGIENIEVLFPDAKAVSNVPEFDKRRTEWVAGVINGTTHRPFSRIKSLSADLTEDEARAKGYIKGELKKEEFFAVSKRVTTPTTIYKKQKLDRDDIIDITDFDVVAWLKAEMRMMLDEELARAVLIGDGREVDDPDKVRDPIGSTEGAGIRSIANEHELYATTITVNIDDANSSPSEIVDAVLLNRKYYKGTGTPTFYTTEEVLTKLLLSKDTLGRRLYRNAAELASELRVADIVPVEVMETETDLVGIIVNLSDYTLGADRGGDVSMFDDFDIDYNQYKYLIETRVSGALTKLKSALVVRKTAGTNVLATPVSPTFDAEEGKLTVPTVTGVVYKHGATTVNAAGSPYDVPAGETWVIDATPASGYYFATSANDQWSFTSETPGG